MSAHVSIYILHPLIVWCCGVVVVVNCWDVNVGDVVTRVVIVITVVMAVG
jgi:hypothetical protein